MFGIISQDEEKALKQQRTHWKTFRQNLHVLPSGFGSFLSSPVLFFEQNIVDAEQGALQAVKFITT